MCTVLIHAIHSMLEYKKRAPKGRMDIITTCYMNANCIVCEIFYVAREPDRNFNEKTRRSKVCKLRVFF